MKRIISAILTVCMLATLIVIPMVNTTAADEPAAWVIPDTFTNTKELYTPEAEKFYAVQLPTDAVVTVDGKADEAFWADAKVIKFNKDVKAAKGHTYSNNLDAEYYIMWDATSLYILEKRTEANIKVPTSSQNNFWSSSDKTFYDICLPTAVTAEKPGTVALIGTWVDGADANSTGDSYNYLRYQKFGWNAEAAKSNSSAGRSRDGSLKTDIGISSAYSIVEGGYVIETKIDWTALGAYNADTFAPAINAEFGLSFYFNGDDYNKHFYPNRAGTPADPATKDGGDSRMFGTIKLVTEAPSTNYPAAVAPAGTGTEADPYIVESVGNLVWMSQQIGDGSVVHGTQSNPFAGKFFKQTKDIDLAGQTIPSIGYYYANGAIRGNLVNGGILPQEDGTNLDADGKAVDKQGYLLNLLGEQEVYKTKYVFGGNYDGQGFKISNGTVMEPTAADHTFDIAYGSGLFGVVFGATIQNVKLDGITAVGASVVGTLVGRAAVDGYSKNVDGTYPTTQVPADFNKIINCSTTATCSVACTYVNTSNWYDHGGRIGGIAGMSGGTTFRNCVNNAAVNGIGGVNFIGGIVGVAGQNTVVNKCVNNGKLTLDVTSNANKGENAMGGIVGFNAPYRTGSTKLNALGGGLVITYCYNTGSFEFKGDKNTGASYWAGILGGGNSSWNLGYTYKIENCLFTGDTLFRMSCGRYDFPASSSVELTLSLTKLRDLEGDYEVYPGHEDPTTLEFERRFNPYVMQPWNL